MTRLNIDILGMCESRWSGIGETLVNGHHICWSGPDASLPDGAPVGQAGVALALTSAARKAMISWTPINERFLTARFNHRHGKLSVVIAYSPTDLATDDVKDRFYATLARIINKVSKHDITIVLTDANATLCTAARDSHPDAVGRFFVDPTTNDNGERLLDFCIESDLKVIDTCFPRKRIHYWTWYSNDGRTKRALDHILVSRRWSTGITQCRVYRSAQLGNTDHRLLSAKLRLKLKAESKSNRTPKFNLENLKDPEIRYRYQVEITNRFNALARTTTSELREGEAGTQDIPNHNGNVNEI